MAKKRVKKEPQSKQDDSKLFAFLAVLLSILGFVIALLAKRDDKYVMFYAKQSLVLFIGLIVIYVTTIVPIIGPVILVLGNIFFVVLWIIQMIYSLSGEEKETPFIGKYAKKINL